MTAFLLMWFWTAFVITGLFMLIYGWHVGFALTGITLGWIVASVIYMLRWFRQPRKS